MSEAMDNLAVLGLARLMYGHYCEHRGFTPKPAPYVPGWATDYAQVAVSAYGYDEDDARRLLGEIGLGVSV